jgi:hypothetical protein
MASTFSGRSMSQTGSAVAMVAVAPDDHVDLPDGPCRGLFVGVGGDLCVHDMRGIAVTLVSGDTQYHPIMVKRVLASGTSAAGVVALY